MNLITKILTGICAFLLIALIASMCIRPVPPSDIQPIYDRYKTMMDSVIHSNQKAIDSLEKQYYLLYLQDAQLQKKYEKLQKQKNQTVHDYRNLKVDQRAIVFLEKTQKTDVKVAAFYKDSLLVPMDNVDSAMSVIIDSQFCDSVIFYKDEEIQNLGSQRVVLKTIISELESMSKMQNEKLNLADLQLSQSEAYLKKVNRRLKWTKVKGTVKDVVIVAGIIYIVIL